MMKNVRIRRFLLLVGFLCLSAVANAIVGWQDTESHLWYNWTDNTKTAVMVIQSQVDSYSGEYTIPASIMVKKSQESDPEEVSVTKIANEAFRGSSVTIVTIEDAITTIGNNAFQNCSSLTNITLPATLQSIGSNAFANTKLTTITIPSSVTSIGGTAFDGCSSLQYATFASIESLCDISFTDTKSNPLYYAKRLFTEDHQGEWLDLEIPEGVTTIRQYAFENCIYLTSVKLPSTVTTIGKDAFIIPSPTNNPAPLSKVTFHSEDALCSINYANEYSNPLYVAHHLWIQGETAERNKVTISTDEVKPYTLAGANNLTSLTITTATEYGVKAFLNCVNLQIVYFSTEEQLRGIKPNGKYANPLNYGATPVVGTTPIVELTFDSNIENDAFTEAKWLTKITINSGVTNIGNSAFKACTNLSSVTINNPSNLRIGKEAFYGCQKLKAINLPKGIVTIDTLAFRSTPLESVTIPASCTKLGTSVFEKCTQLTNVTFTSGINLTAIPNFFFNGCLNLMNITIPDMVTTIGESAFSGCVKLAAPVLSQALTTINSSSFAGCTGFTNVVLSGHTSLTSIGANAFSGCKKVTMISLPSSIQTIYENAFTGNEKLTDIYIHKKEPFTVYDNSFGDRSNITLHLEDNTAKDAFQGNEDWQGFKDYVVKTLCTLSFYLNDEPYGESITKESGMPIDRSEIPMPTVAKGDSLSVNWQEEVPLTMPNENQIFYAYIYKTRPINGFVYFLQPSEIENGKNLENRATLLGVDPDAPLTAKNIKLDFNERNPIVYENTNYNLIVVGDSALKGATMVQQIILPSTIKSLGVSAFKNCRSLMNINIPEAVTVFSDSLFYGCSELSMDIPNQITMIDTLAFASCTKFNPKSLANVKEIKYQAFTNTGLKKVTIPSSVTEIGEEVFKDCKNLEKVEFANGFNQPLPKYSFWNCTKLKDVKLTGAMQSVGINAFQGCTSLTNMELPDGITIISNGAYQGCRNLRSISLPPSTDYIGTKAFSRCDTLFQITVLKEDPPFAIKDAFDSINYEKATLYVENVSKYKNAEPWNEFKKFITQTIRTLTYKVNGEELKSDSIAAGSLITPLTAEALIEYDKYKNKKAKEFSGWKDLPEVMPDSNIIAEGNFQYEIKYYIGSVTEENRILGDEEYLFFCSDSVAIPTEKLDSVGCTYTLTGLQESEVSEYDIPKLNMKMPSRDLNVVVSYKNIEITDASGIKYKVIDIEDDKHAEVVLATDKNIQSVNIPQTISYENDSYDVTVIQKDAFRGLKKLTSVTINSNIGVIGDNAFDECSSLATLNLPEKLDSVGNQAFAHTAITEITVPNIQKTGREFFYWCTKLKEVGFRSSLTSLPGHIFRNCKSLETIDIPNGIKTIGESAFEGCSDLKNVELPEDLDSIGDGAFSECKAIKLLTLPATLRVIGSRAFYQVFGDDDILTVEGELPSAQGNTFDDEGEQITATLKTSATELPTPWSNFANHEPLEGGSTIGQCDPPVITYDKKNACQKLVMSCPTEGATIVSSISVKDVQRSEANEISLWKIFTVTAYAKKDGMRRSETVTQTFDFEVGDVDHNGEVDTRDATEILKMLVQ